MNDALRQIDPIDILYRSAARLAASRPLLLGETELTTEIVEGLYHGIADAAAEIREAIAALEIEGDSPNGDPDDGEPAIDLSASPRLRLVAARRAA